MKALRYIRAFWLALKMTLRGETIQPRPKSPLALWVGEAGRLIEAVYAAADAQGLNREARQQLVMRIDKRDLTVETALTGIRHHVMTEYPYLLRNRTSYTVAAIHATNLNDRYLVQRIAELEALPTGQFQESLGRLKKHLETIPGENSELDST
jgi:hypothetical protein